MIDSEKQAEGSRPLGSLEGCGRFPYANKLPKLPLDNTGFRSVPVHPLHKVDMEYFSSWGQEETLLSIATSIVAFLCVSE